MRLWAVIFLSLGLMRLEGAPANAANPLPACPDTATLLPRFQEGDTLGIYSAWTRYFTRLQAPSISPRETGCTVFGRRMLGVLDLELQKDTAAAMREFSKVVAASPRQQMWDLNLSADAQAAWDYARERGPEMKPEELWDLRWTPPQRFESARDPALRRLRKTYHEARRLYAVTEKSEHLRRLLTELAGETDPAFVLLRAEIRLRLKEPAAGIAHELDLFQEPKSLILAPHHLVTWRGRLGDRFKNLPPEAP